MTYLYDAKVGIIITVIVILFIVIILRVITFLRGGRADFQVVYATGSGREECVASITGYKRL